MQGAVEGIAVDLVPRPSGVAKWITDENFNEAISNPPKITSGKVVVSRNGVAAAPSSKYSA